MKTRGERFGYADPMNSTDKKKARAKQPGEERISRGLLGMAALTERVARPVLGRQGQGAAQIFGRWADIVGPSLAGVSMPEKLQRDRSGHGATLHLRVSSGAAAAMIQPQTPQIVDRVNAYLGPGAITKLTVSQGPLSLVPQRPKPPRSQPLNEGEAERIERDLAAVDSEPVRRALAKLGARLKARRES